MAVRSTWAARWSLTRVAGVRGGADSASLRGMHPKDRSRLTFMIRYAARHPGRIVPYGRRLARDAMLRLKNRDHVSYYRAVMKSEAAND